MKYIIIKEKVIEVFKENFNDWIPKGTLCRSSKLTVEPYREDYLMNGLCMDYAWTMNGL